MTEYTLYQGDCLDSLKKLPDNSVDSIVTDPPYGISFMGKKWDIDVPTVAIWEECLRVLKPGGHLLAFAGTRTQHRMATRIEDAGFEIRDMIAWVYGTGFPKSRNISKDMDKMSGMKREVLGKHSGSGMTKSNVDHGAQIRNVTEWDIVSDKAISENGIKWDGWGTALKPSLEPITVARKPFDGTVASNVLEFGTGAINIDGCRVELNGDYKSKPNGRPSQTGLDDGYDSKNANIPDTVGRWPANLIIDESDEVAELFPQTTSGKPGIKRKATNDGPALGAESRAPGTHMGGFGDSGSAARFFYCAKTSKKDRNEGLDADGQNVHTTVKPTALMQYLVRLVTPPSGIVLDPFMGSGSTGKAAMYEGFNFIGMELDETYMEIAKGRIEFAKNDKKPVANKPQKEYTNDNNLTEFFE